MLSKELEDALNQLGKARGKVTQLEEEYEQRRAEYGQLTDARTNADKAKRKYERNLARWHELDKQFDDENAWLVDALNDARGAWYETQKLVHKIINKIIEVEND